MVVRGEGREQGRRKERRDGMRISDVNKDWTCNDKDKDQAYKD